MLTLLRCVVVFGSMAGLAITTYLLLPYAVLGGCAAGVWWLCFKGVHTPIDTTTRAETERVQRNAATMARISERKAANSIRRTGR